jgi:hypothetical protein
MHPGEQSPLWVQQLLSFVMLQEGALRHSSLL